MGNISAVFEKTINQVISSVQDTFVPSSGKISSSYDVDNMDLDLTGSNGKDSNIYDSNISEFTSSKESYVNLQNLAKTELGNIDTIINNANQENNLVKRYIGYSRQSKSGYGPFMQAAQEELKRVEPELDNYIKANSSYSSYSELINTQAELEKIDQTCGELIAYYERQIKWQEYYKIYDSEECQKSSIEGMLGEKEYHDNMSGKTFRSEEYTKLLEIRTIGNYDDKLKELFGDDYQEQFASYGLDFQFDYLKMYNYLYQTQGEEAAKEFYAFAEDNINSMYGLYLALLGVNQLTTNAEYMEAVTNYLNVHASGIGDGVVSSLEGVVAWFSDNRSRTATSYEIMWYSMMLETGKYGKGQVQVFNYQVGQGTGQMLPVMLIGCVCPESLIVADAAAVTGETAGAILLSSSTIASLRLSQLAASGYLLMSSGGRDYKEQMINGKSRDEAIIHGLLSGTTEVTTEHLLGGLPFLRETKVYNLKTLAIAMGREGAQEVCQDMIAEFLLGDGIPNFNSEEERDAYWDQWLKGKMMTFAVAACSAGELQGGSVVMAQTNINYINNQIKLGKITEQEVVDLIKTQYPTETMNLSNQQIIGEYNAQIAKYTEIKLKALLKMPTEVTNTSTDEGSLTISSSNDINVSSDDRVTIKNPSSDEFTSVELNSFYDPFEEELEHQKEVQALMIKYDMYGPMDLMTLLYYPDGNTTSSLVEAYLNVIFEKAKDASSPYNKFLSSYFNKLEGLLDVKRNPTISTYLSNYQIMNYKNQMEDVKKAYIKTAKTNFLENVKKHGIEYKLDNNNHPVFLNLKPNSIYELKWSYDGLQGSFLVYTNSIGEGYSLFDKEFNIDNNGVFLDGNVVYKDRLKIDSFELNDTLSETAFDPNSRCYKILRNNGVAFGVNQGVFTDPMAVETFLGVKSDYYHDYARTKTKQILNLYAQEINIVRQYFPDLKVSTILQYLAKIDSEGACTYAAALNVLIMEMATNPEFSFLMENPEVFSKVFGYDLYRISSDGTSTFNQELFLADFYTFVNKNNETIFQIQKDGSTVFLDPNTYVDQVYLAGKGFDRVDLIEDYLNYKLKEAGYNERVRMRSDKILSNFFDPDDGYLYMPYSPTFADDFYNALANRLANGENFRFSIYSVTSSNVFQMYQYNPKTGVHDIERSYKSMCHDMTITQVARDGVYVQSWGESYFIPYESLKNCDFSVNNLIANVESEAKP